MPYLLYWLIRSHRSANISSDESAQALQTSSVVISPIQAIHTSFDKKLKMRERIEFQAIFSISQYCGSKFLFHYTVYGPVYVGVGFSVILDPSGDRILSPSCAVLYCIYMHPYVYTVSRTTVQLLHRM